MDKVSCDQNYECTFAAENMSLLSCDLISQADSEDVGFICEDQRSREALEFLSGPKTQASLFSVSIGRTQDWTIITVPVSQLPQKPG
jgi:hypothetical protein